MSLQHKYQKTFFKHHKKHGIYSFKYTSYPQDIKRNIMEIRTECVECLRKGVCNGRKGISLTIESPVFCKDYAEINVNRKVPLRQYYGRELLCDDKTCSKRTCYGVGSGASTVGSDPITNKTRLMSKVMMKMCNDLSSKPYLFMNKKQSCSSTVTFNHVTVLYYLSKGPSDHILLNPHCDAVVSTGNIYNVKNSQQENTPTVVLSFSSAKEIVFFKRYSDGNTFEDHQFVDSMKLDDGDMFVLHPCDERVVQREVIKGGKKYTKEEKRSQFKHGVNFSSKKTTNEIKEAYEVAISVCFRNVQTTASFDKKTDCVVSTKNNNGDKEPSHHQKKRIKLLDEKRNDIYDPENRKAISKELEKFYNSVI